MSADRSEPWTSLQGYFFRPLVGKHPGNVETQAEDFPKLNTELMAPQV